MAEDEFEEFATEDEAPPPKPRGGGINLGLPAIILNVVVLALVIVLFTRGGGTGEGMDMRRIERQFDQLAQRIEVSGQAGGCMVDPGDEEYFIADDAYPLAVNADADGNPRDIIVNTADGRRIMAVSLSVVVQIPNARDVSQAQTWMARNQPIVLDAVISPLSEISIRKTDEHGLQMFLPNGEQINKGGMRRMLSSYLRRMGLGEIKDVLITNLVIQ